MICREVANSRPLVVVFSVRSAWSAAHETGPDSDAPTSSLWLLSVREKLEETSAEFAFIVAVYAIASVTGAAAGRGLPATTAAVTTPATATTATAAYTPARGLLRTYAGTSLPNAFGSLALFAAVRFAASLTA
jgi:hypothetical protein